MLVARSSVISLGFVLASATLASACGSATPSADMPPEHSRKRPEPLRSASDGEIMGAQQQAPSDTLEASATTEHPGAGWAVEDGTLVRTREVHSDSHPSAAECEEAAKAPPAEGAQKRKRNPACPPQPKR